MGVGVVIRDDLGSVVAA